MISRRLSLALGILSFLPLLGFGYAIAVGYSVLGKVIASGGSLSPATLLDLAAEIGLPFFVAAVVNFGLFIICLWHLFTRRVKEPNAQILWALLLLAFSVITIPIYCFLFLGSTHRQKTRTLVREAGP